MFDAGRNTPYKDLVIKNFKDEQTCGDRVGQWSIRINEQYRICFQWREIDAYDVEIVDYH